MVDNFNGLFAKQAMFLVVGILVMVAASLINWRLLAKNSFATLLLYVLGVIFTAGVFVLGADVRGVKSWYAVGPFTIEPSEFFKIILIFFFARFFSQRYIDMYRPMHILISALYALIPAILIIVQPDMGSALIIIFIWLGMLLISGIKRKHIIIILLTGIIAITVGYNFILKDYQQARIVSFLNPYLDPRGTGYQAIQAVSAIGSGGLWGKYWTGEYSLTELGYLPEAQNDFVFAAIGEMFGLIGITLILFLYGFTIWRLYLTATNVSDNFAKLFIAGYMVLLVSQGFINFGMNVRILPITGITLPFVSYGGSSILSLFLGLGIVQSLKK